MSGLVLESGSSSLSGNLCHYIYVSNICIQSMAKPSTESGNNLTASATWANSYDAAVIAIETIDVTLGSQNVDTVGQLNARNGAENFRVIGGIGRLSQCHAFNFSVERVDERVDTEAIIGVVGIRHVAGGALVDERRGGQRRADTGGRIGSCWQRTRWYPSFSPNRRIGSSETRRRSSRVDGGPFAWPRSSSRCRPCWP